MSVIKVIHIVSNISQNSGIMRVIMNFYTHIDRNRFQFEFLYFDEYDKDFKKQIKSLGGKAHQIPRPNLLKPRKMIAEIKKFFIEQVNEYKVIHIHDLIIGPFCGYFGKKYGAEKVVVHSHSTKYSNSFLKSIRNYLAALPLKFQKSIKVSCSVKAGTFLFGKKKSNNHEIIILHNAISYENFIFNLQIRNLIRKELNVEKKWVIGHVGRFSIEKNHKFMIDIIDILKKFDSNILLLLVGDGPIKPNIEKLVREKGLQDNVILLGLRNDVNKLYQAMDYFILPSHFEGLGMVAIEAQVSGLQCLISSAAPPEVIISERAKQKEIASPAQWAEEIKDYINGNIMRNFEQMGIDESYSIKKEVKKLESIYLNYRET